MSRFGISQNFRNATLLGRFARTEHETKNSKDEKVSSTSSSSSSVDTPSTVASTNKSVKKQTKSSLTAQPSANKMSAVTARYVTKSADHL